MSHTAASCVLTERFCVCLGTGPSSQARGQHKLWVLLAAVLEQCPQPDELACTMAMSGGRIDCAPCWRWEHSRCSFQLHNKPMALRPKPVGWGGTGASDNFRNHRRQEQGCKHHNLEFLYQESFPRKAQSSCPLPPLPPRTLRGNLVLTITPANTPVREEHQCDVFDAPRQNPGDQVL